jgi:hypothetical protein
MFRIYPLVPICCLPRSPLQSLAVHPAGFLKELDRGHGLTAFLYQRHRETIAFARPDRVVVLAPLSDDDLRLLQAVEDFAVEQLIT